MPAKRLPRQLHWIATVAGAVAFVASLASPRLCRADDQRPEAADSSDEKPDDSSDEKPDDSSDEKPDDSSGKKPDDPSDEKAETEFTVVPFVGGNSDMGFGGGFIASLARLEPDLEPYLYRLEAAGSITVGPDDDKHVRVPYTDVYLLFSFPNLVRDHVGLDIRVSYTAESNLKYYGLGNASSVSPGLDPTDSFYEHSRVHPTIAATWEYRLKPFSITWGASYTQNWFDIPEGTLLASEMQSPDPYVRGLLGDAKSHGVPEVSGGIAWDTRDDETSPVRGIYITEQLAVTPGTFGAADYRFARVDSAVHAFVPLVARDRRLVLALRAASDLLFGDPPFYELPRFEDTFAIGGAKGVRGVPGQRYYGRIKVFSNIELRSELFSAKVFGEERRFGVVAFADTGRVWADYRRRPELDGTGLGLKYGVGGGLRVASGKTFVLRLDVAWSPDANPISGYLLAGHIF